jgi:hypothetical protein
MLPDVILLGPFPLVTRMATAIAGAALFLFWVTRRARRAGLDAGLAGDILSGAMLAAVLGAKGLDVLLSLPSHLETPALLLVLPTGGRAATGALLGAAGYLAWQYRRRRAPLPLLADQSAVPALAGLAVAAAGRPVPHALAGGLALLLATVLLHRLSRWALFPGHLGLAAVVFGAAALAVSDIFGPGMGRVFGLSALQVLSLAAGATAWLAARRLAAAAEGGPAGAADDEPAAGDGARGGTVNVEE